MVLKPPQPSLRWFSWNYLKTFPDNAKALLRQIKKVTANILLLMASQNFSIGQSHRYAVGLKIRSGEQVPEAKILGQKPVNVPLSPGKVFQ
jgi:hypothetical protein